MDWIWDHIYWIIYLIVSLIIGFYMTGRSYSELGLDSSVGKWNDSLHSEKVLLGVSAPQVITAQDEFTIRADQR